MREQVSADTRKFRKRQRGIKARASPEVAEVVNLPKKRPGRRLRSSITIRATSRQAMV